jgi:hypothetical protein
MTASYNRRCALCGQYQITEDREALLEEERFEWDESLVDDFIAGNRHLCVDTDPYGARQSARMIEAGEMVPELRWLIAGELERRQAAAAPAWAVFTASITLGAMVAKPLPRAAVAYRSASSGSPRPAEGRVCDHVAVDHIGRSPPGTRVTSHRSPSPVAPLPRRSPCP